MDPVIRRVASAIKPSSEAERLIIIDKKTRKAIEKKPLFGDVRYYIVSNNSESWNYADDKISGLKLSNFDNSVEVSIHYRVECEPGDEEKIAEALYDGDHPGARLNNLITNWLTQFSQPDLLQFLKTYFSDAAELPNYLSDRAYKETGLKLKARISLGAEKFLKPITINPLHIPVLLRDFDKAQDLILSAALEVDDDCKPQAILHTDKNASLQGLLIQETKKYFQRNVTLQGYYFDLSKDSTKGPLATQLNQALLNAGRRASMLALSHQLSDLPEEFFQTTDINVDCKIQGYPQLVTIKNTVQMTLHDAAKYRSAQSPDLKSWLEERLARVISELLFNTTYTELLTDFKPKEKQIREIIGEQTQAIGYEIKHLITIPDLAPITWKESLVIDTGDVTFDTRSRDVKVKLQIIANTRISDLKSIKSYLDRQQDVKELMTKAVINDIRQYLHDIDPQRFYMRFYFTDIEGETTVEEQLKERTESALRKFNADVISVIPKVLDTELITRLKELMKALSPFNVHVQSLHGGESYTFKGQFQVDAVHSTGWHQFQLRNSGIEEIRKYLEEYVMAELKTVPKEALAYRSYAQKKELKEIVEKLAQKGVLAAFGLSISLPTLHREHTELEVETNTVLINRDASILTIETAKLEDEVRLKTRENQAKSRQAEKILEKITALTGVDGAEEEIEELYQLYEEAKQRPDSSLSSLSFEELKNRIYRKPAKELIEAGGEELKALLAENPEPLADPSGDNK